MGYDQWIAISNKNESSAFTLKIQNVKLISGKFYTCSTPVLFLDLSIPP